MEKEQPVNQTDHHGQPVRRDDAQESTPPERRGAEGLAALGVRSGVGAIDEEMTSKAYIVPGLGDAGDLAYGEKMG